MHSIRSWDNKPWHCQFLSLDSPEQQFRSCLSHDWHQQTRLSQYLTEFHTSWHTGTFIRDCTWLVSHSLAGRVSPSQSVKHRTLHYWHLQIVSRFLCFIKVWLSLACNPQTYSHEKNVTNGEVWVQPRLKKTKLTPLRTLISSIVFPLPPTTNYSLPRRPTHWFCRELFQDIRTISFKATKRIPSSRRIDTHSFELYGILRGQGYSLECW